MSSSVSLSDRTWAALSWRFLSVCSLFSIQFSVGVILARLLPVDAFGLLGLAMIVVGFGNVISEIGMVPALIQREDLTATHIRVAFTVSVLTGATLTTIMYLCAPLAALIFRTDQLISLIRLLSLTFLLNSFSATAGALLQRRLRFQSLCWVDVVSYAFGYSAVGVVLALNGWGVWALGWASFVQSLVRTALLLMVSPHPLRPSIATNETKQLLRFSTGISLARIMNYAARNADYFIVGRWLGPEALGLYTRAYQLMTASITQLSSVISPVLFPAYSEIQNDSDRLRRAYLRSVSVIALIVCPLLVSLAIAAPELIHGIYGPKWGGAIASFQILCAGGVARVVYNLADTLARAKGAVYAQFGRHFLYMVAIITASAVGARWGIEGVALGVVLGLVLMYFLMAHLANKLIRSSWHEFLRAHIPGLLLGVIVAGVGLPVMIALRTTQLPPLVILGAISVTYAITLITAVRVLPQHWFGEARLFFSYKPALGRKMNVRSLQSSMFLIG
jgi:O-antigen/teichoic acid export membrane protein